MRYLTLLPCLFLFLVLLPSAARAQDACLNAVPCKELIDSGQLLSKSKKFDAALSAYETAYQKWPVPWLLVNIGRMQQKLGQLDVAAASLRQYLSDPAAQRDDKTRTRASEYLTQIEDEQSKQKIAPAPEPKAAPVEPPEKPIEVVGAKQVPIYKRWWFWTAVGGAVAIGVTLAAVLGTQIDPRPKPDQIVDLRGGL